MRLKEYASDIAQLSGINKLLILLSIGSIFANCILAIALLSIDKSEKIIITPPTLDRSFWVHGDKVDKEYLTQMATWFLSLNLNYSSDTIKNQTDIILRYVHPSKHAALSKLFNDEIAKIHKNRQSNVFYPIKVVVKNQQVAVIGDFRRFIGEKKVEQKRKAYLIEFKFNTGRLSIWDLKEVDINAPFSNSVITTDDD